MAIPSDSTIEKLRDAVLRYGDSNSGNIRHFVQGNRVIQQGEVSDTCYLIRSGTLSILVRSEARDEEREVALRYEREFIGETAFLQRGVPRTASVDVFSSTAELVSITRDDLFTLLANEPGLQDVIGSLWELSASRKRETSAVLGGKIQVRTQIVSAALADIHNFSSLGEMVWEEEMDGFLFNFLELSDDITNRYGGKFEDQGDGFKVLFHDDNHARRAVSCSLDILSVFRELRDARSSTLPDFSKIGLGIGVCTDFMSFRRRAGHGPENDRVMSHALNVAAAISKYRESIDETEIYIDRTSMNLVGGMDIEFSSPEDILLEKIGRRETVYRVIGPVAKAVRARPPEFYDLPNDLKAFISYSHSDVKFVSMLTGRLETDGVAVWVDSTRILVGDDIDREISRGIQENQIILCVFSQESLASDWVAREFDEASHESIVGNKVLLPIIYGDVQVDELPGRIRRKKCVFFGEDFEAAYSELIESIRQHSLRDWSMAR